MSVLQGNLDRIRTAHHILALLCSEKKADIVINQRTVPGKSRSRIVRRRIGHRGHLDPRSSTNTCVGPRIRTRLRLDQTGGSGRRAAGNVRGSHCGWRPQCQSSRMGEARPDLRGRRIMEVASRLEQSVLNTGSTSTLRRPGYRDTITDVSLANEYLVAKVAGWQVIEDYTGSDHQYILFDVHDRRPAVTSVKRPPRWNIVRMDQERLSLVIEEGWRSQQSTSASLPPPVQARLISAAGMQLIQKASSIAVPKNGTKRQRCPLYWWTNEIADLRKKGLKLRRLAQRTKRRDHDAASLAVDYQAAKKTLKRSIKASQRRCWTKLCIDDDQNPWGLGYLIVTRNLWTNTQGIPQDARTLYHIVHTLFPPQLKSFPAPWKKASIVLISKGKDPVEAASSYRPICMLDTAGKLLEKLIRPRLRAAVKAARDIAGRQYGFRSGLSTIYAVQEVVTAAKMMERGNHRTQSLCLLATLDVINAFNSVRWDLAREALERKFGVPKYLFRIIDNYLNERFLVYNKSDGPRSLELTSGAFRGSILEQ
ncbi:uncharacterized protein LOC118448521 [Vespa mandarinia]|uniref:uncharacterized protein LOC118448521 n=1 Tax=Vespa mandarinia TaxID=7446 RepID=UPI001618B52C|nr:uncharacterized protein LOC118448521 [Vespa mandarinia]